MSNASPAALSRERRVVRALRIGLEKSEDEWLYSGGVKSQMQRMNPAFKEKTLGYKSFTDFVGSRDDVVEVKKGAASNAPRLRTKG